MKREDETMLEARSFRASATAPRELPRRRVLLVDDSATVRSLVRVFLMGRSLEFVDAADGAVALAIARTETIDLIIVDYNMPRMDGLAFVREIRKDAAVCRTPIIVLSADKTPSLRRDMLSSGAQEVLQKPVSKAFLGDAVERLIGAVAR